MGPKTLTMILFCLLAMSLAMFCDTGTAKPTISALPCAKSCEDDLPLLRESDVIISILNNMIASAQSDLDALQAYGENCMLLSYVRQLLHGIEPETIQDLSDWCKQIPDNGDVDEADQSDSDNDTCAKYCHAIAQQRTQLVEYIYKKARHLETRLELEYTYIRCCPSQIAAKDKTVSDWWHMLKGYHERAAERFVVAAPAGCKPSSILKDESNVDGSADGDGPTHSGMNASFQRMDWAMN